jgi:hypothetical protein
MIIVQTLTEDNEFEEVGRVQDGKIVSGEQKLISIDDVDVWTQMSEEELTFRFNGPRIVAGIVEEEED